MEQGEICATLGSLPNVTKCGWRSALRCANLRGLAGTTVFGKHCECNAQKCTHLKRLPTLGSPLLLLSHCVLTQHEGQKKQFICPTPGVEQIIPGMPRKFLTTLLTLLIKPEETLFSLVKCRHFKLQITNCAENGKIQLTPKITNHYLHIL